MPPRRKVATGPTPVEDLRHEDTRANIPTGELAGFVADEQDSADLEVPSVPIYVQEKVVPRAIVEDLRRSGPGEDDVPSLCDDFDGLDFGDKVDFYAHEANWSNPHDPRGLAAGHDVAGRAQICVAVAQRPSSPR